MAEPAVAKVAAGAPKKLPLGGAPKKFSSVGAATGGAPGSSPAPGGAAKKMNIGGGVKAPQPPPRPGGPKGVGAGMAKGVAKGPGVAQPGGARGANDPSNGQQQPVDGASGYEEGETNGVENGVANISIEVTPDSSTAASSSDTNATSSTGSTAMIGGGTEGGGIGEGLSSSSPLPGGSNGGGDVYTQKSFRSTVQVDFGTLRKGPSAFTLQPGSATPNPNANPEDYATPANAQRRLEEAFSDPMFSKVEITIKSKRDNAAYELLTTEQSYCRSLTIMNDLYRMPLLEACKRGLLPQVTEDSIHDIFSRYFTDITRVNFVLLQGLVERFNDWSDTQFLGDLLLDLLPFLKMYTMYTSNYDRSMAALRELEAKHETVTKFMEEINANPLRTVDFRAYLIMPIQRIPRYRLLLEELLKNTTPEHPDYESLSKALDSIKHVAIQIDAAIVEHKNRDKLLEIQSSFVGEKVQIIEAGRVFIKEGELGKICRKDVQKRSIWLFNDLFLYAKQIPPSSRFSKHRAFPLKSVRVKDIPDNGQLYKNAIQVASEKKSFILLANTPEEKASWMAEFAKAILDQETRIRVGNTDGPGTMAPVWVPDSEAIRCMICGDKFTFTQRRHHCRQCGNVVCSKCSAKKKELPGQGKKRVCDSCYTKPYPDSASPGPNGAAPGGGAIDKPAVSVGPITIHNTTPSPGPGGMMMTTGTSLSPGTPGAGGSPTPGGTPTPTSTSPAPQVPQGGQRPGEMHRAAYDYDPPVENPKKKLAFKAGDLMEITIKNDPGWWFAIMGETRGWVPAAFLEPVV